MMDAGSVAGTHRAELGGMGVVMVARRVWSCVTDALSYKLH